MGYNQGMAMRGTNQYEVRNGVVGDHDRHHPPLIVAGGAAQACWSRPGQRASLSFQQEVGIMRGVFCTYVFGLAAAWIAGFIAAGGQGLMVGGCVYIALVNGIIAARAA